MKGFFRKIPPRVLQVSLGTIVSKTLDAMVKWPNDVIASDGRKMAGVLIEYSGDEIRIGIGANKKSFSRWADPRFWMGGDSGRCSCR